MQIIKAADLRFVTDADEMGTITGARTIFFLAGTYETYDCTATHNAVQAEKAWPGLWA
jgi:hypothetical protein